MNIKHFLTTKITNLVESGSTADVAGCNGGAGAETGRGNLVEEDAAVVNL
jgi:hypothetical protein